MLKSIMFGLIQQKQAHGDEGLEFPDYFQDFAEEILEEVKCEKLSCSANALRLLQRVQSDKTRAMNWRTNITSLSGINSDQSKV
jgi:hypothetical protein